jgi:hypothetical protein
MDKDINQLREDIIDKLLDVQTILVQDMKPNKEYHLVKLDTQAFKYKSLMIKLDTLCDNTIEVYNGAVFQWIACQRYGNGTPVSLLCDQCLELINSENHIPLKDRKYGYFKLPNDGVLVPCHTIINNV